MAGKISRQTLIVNYKRVVARKYYGSDDDWQKVRFADPLSKYFPGGSPAVVAFAAELNGTERFRSDGMDLVASDVRDLTTIGGFFAAIEKNYESNGFAVTQ